MKNARTDRNTVHPAIIRRLRAAGCPMPFREKNERPVDLTIEVNRPELTKSYAIRAGAEYVLQCGSPITHIGPWCSNGLQVAWTGPLL